MDSRWSFAGLAAGLVLCAANFGVSMRFGGWERDVDSSRVHVNAFPVSLGSHYVWMESGERLAVRYRVKVEAGGLNVWVNGSKPWQMSNGPYAHLAVERTGEGTWYPEAKPGWNHVLLGTSTAHTRSGLLRQLDRHVEYSVTWKVERTPAR